MNRLVLAAACAIALLGLSAPASAQGTPAERQALAVVEKLFDAMRAGDSAALRPLFVANAVLGTIAPPRGGGATVFQREDGIEDFVKGVVGSRPPNVWDERIANPKVLVDGDLAAVWVDYTFYLGDRKSHCGVDAIQLVRGADGWKIFSLADTRRRENCPDLPKK